MVDLHSHILPQIDDGSDSFEESLLMLKRAAMSGVDTIVATPHWLPGSFMVSNGQRDVLVDKLQMMTDEAGISIKIVPGRECYFAPELFGFDEDFNNFTVGRMGRYLLIESPMQQIPSYVDQMVFDIQVRGIIPIIAHVERYADVISDPNVVLKFIENGCLIQVNMGSIRGRYGPNVQDTALALLSHHMVHIVASDMHTSHSTPLGEGLMELNRVVGVEEARELVDARPRAVVEGVPVSKREPLVYSRKKPWWKIW